MNSRENILASRRLGDALSPGTNSLNALRLVFACCVIVSHAWWLGGYGPEPTLYGIKLGTAGVLGFFAISGYLITISANRSTIFDYAVARFTRIYPGLVAAALTVAFVAAPIGALLSHGQYDQAGALAFFSSAVTLTIGFMKTPPIGTTLTGNNDNSDWDGPLWTLTWEVLCYVIVALTVFLLRRTSRVTLGTIVFLLFAAATGAVSGKILAGGFRTDRTEFVLPFIAIFLAGSLLATQRKWVPVGLLPGLLAALLTWGALVSGYGAALAPLPLAYLVLSIGSIRTGSRIGSQADISYGLYIYGWPIQQLLATVRLPLHVPAPIYAVLALLASWPLAFLSCALVEQPTQRVRRAILRRSHSVQVEDPAE